MAELTVPKSEPYISKPIQLRVSRYGRADLEFHGVDHSGWSYEARIFINNKDAHAGTKPTPENRYIGSYHIFGHGGCFGDVGHCDVPTVRRPYDTRRSHPLIPITKRIDVTEGLRKHLPLGGEFTITLVPIVTGGTDKCDPAKLVQFSEIKVVTYE